MNAKTFVDTNILLYANDVHAGSKRETAIAALDELWAGKDGALSMQVLHEFYVNCIRKLKKPLLRADARLIVESYFPWCVASSTEDIASAFRLQDQAQISYWDALLVAAAARSGAERLLTEDLNHNQRIAGVLIVNPFLK